MTTIPTTRTELGLALMMLMSVLKVCVESNPAICGISSTDEFCNDGVDGGNTEEDEDEDQSDPEALSFSKARTGQKTVRSFFSAHSIRNCDKMF